MSAVKRIIERLKRHPELVYGATATTITVNPPTVDGFAVSLIEEARAWIVAFDGWHKHLAAEDEALHCFALGLSGQCRLRVDYRGFVPHRWTLETQTDHGWRADSTVGQLLFAFWRHPRVEYRRNTLWDAFAE
jgi:hypothetical protein